MNVELFQLDFSRTLILLLTFIPVAINLGIFVYISLKIQRTRVTGYFSFYVFSLGMWQMCEGFLKLSVHPEAALVWNRIILFFILFVILFGLLFAVYFTKLDKKISWNVLFIILILPLIIFLVCNVAHLDEYTIVASDTWFWIVNPKPTFITETILVWISVGGIITLFLLWLHCLKKDKPVLEHKQSLLLAIGFTIPTIIGITVEVIFPLVFNINGIPVTSTFTTAFSVIAFVAIKKYHMLDFSPKHHWEDIVKTMNEGILIVDLDEKIKYANPAFCNLLGYDFEEMKEKNATKLFITNFEEQIRMKSRLESRKQMLSEHYEIQLTTKKGEKKWLIVGGSPFFDKDGKVVGSIGIHSDISARKQVEENLILSNNELEIFIYKASHDLRGPLASIIGLVNVSNFEIKDGLAKEYMNMIGSSTQKLDDTLKELVKTMKIKDTARFDDLIDFRDLIEAKLSEFKYFKGYELLTITTNIKVFDNFYSNKFLIETILHNLIENSIKYQSVCEPKAFLKINVLENDKNDIHIIIEDNGIGIKSSVQGLIFDMYYKAVETSKGSGLGLYLVKKCVEKLDGEIELKSTPGKGSIFTIVLKNRATYLNKFQY